MGGESSGAGRDFGGTGFGGGSRRQRRSMRFIQLYTSPSFRHQRSKLVAPPEDWEESERDVSRHKFSPVVSVSSIPRLLLLAMHPILGRYNRFFAYTSRSSFG